MGSTGTHGMRPSTRTPSRDPLHRTGKWGPTRARKPPGAHQCQQPGQTWLGHRPHRQGPEPAPNSNLCSLGSEPGPSSASWGTRQKPEHAGRKDSASCLLGTPDKVERQSGDPGQAPPGPDTCSAARRQTRRHQHTPASSTSKCFFWSKCGATTLLWVVKLSVGAQTCHGSLWPGGPPRSCPGQRVYSV